MKVIVRNWTKGNVMAETHDWSREELQAAFKKGCIAVNHGDASEAVLTTRGPGGLGLFKRTIVTKADFLNCTDDDFAAKVSIWNYEFRTYLEKNQNQTMRVWLTIWR